MPRPELDDLAVFLAVARERSFTRAAAQLGVSREDRYKAKSFIDTVVYGLGDQVGAWSYAGLAALGWTLHDIALAAIPVCILWMGNAMWLGRREIRMATDQAAAAETARAATPA